MLSPATSNGGCGFRHPETHLRPGAAVHLTTEALKQAAGIDMMHVPYKGAAPATQDLIGKQIRILV
jgi:hypothetical protein